MRIPAPGYSREVEPIYINLEIAGIVLGISAQKQLKIKPELLQFLVSESLPADITVEVSWDWKSAVSLRSKAIGRDMLLIYYRENGYCYCELDGGDRGAMSQTRYTPDFSQVSCIINTEDFHVDHDYVHQILRMLPIRQMVLSRSVLFLHASQVMYENKGILFSAPSGTGKTTQAKLWRQFRNAEIICNDRTLLKEANGAWRTYGYPYDGSEPVRSNQVLTLGAIVLLQQASENKIVRLSPAKALSLLLGQSVIDTWNPESRLRAIELIARMLEKIPVYQLGCTISEQAVTVLEHALQKEGIIHGQSF